jgi:hypothetical protein
VIVYVNLLVAIVGVLTYALATNPKLCEIGRILFWTGMLTFLFGDAAIVKFLQR